jgi:hypothetical protein
MYYVVYTEIIGDEEVERWYYGLYNSKNWANEVALELGHNDNVYHCVCREDEAKDLGIKNLPYGLRH